VTGKQKVIRKATLYEELNSLRNRIIKGQMHISKEGDPYLRTLLVQGAQHILGPFGVDCDLRRWRLKLAERGGRSGRSEPSLRPRESWRCCCITCG
jgi:hypothetical protein